MRKHRLLGLCAVGISIVLLASACGDDSSDSVDLTQDGSVLQKVLDADVLECGVNNGLAGFGNVDPETGEFSGFDIDFCRAIAAAVLGDADKVNYTALNPGQRFPTLQQGEIDVLIRNTTRTASRDGDEQATFLKTTFFDGQGFMVRADSGIDTLQDMANTTICVLTGTTTLLNLNAVFNDLDIPFTPAPFDDNIALEPAFVAEQCEVWTSDASQLASFAAGLEVDVTILPDIISKEPLGPAVLDGDSQWAQIVDWTTMATIQAWEWGINQANLETFRDTGDTNIRLLLGLPIEDDDGNEAVKDLGLGVPTDFAWNVIEQVGNYEDIHVRHLAPLGIELAGSDNDLYLNGGLQYVPPFR